jgi:cob(I)alamin adenosyltransferase
MLDPLSAVGLASAIVQFIDFSLKLVTEGRELYEKGSLTRNDELEFIAEDLKRLAAGLAKSQLKNPYMDEKQIQKLASTCKNLADELLELLATLHPQKQNTLESFRVALRTAKSKGKTEDMERRLRRLQGQINTHMIMIMR